MFSQSRSIQQKEKKTKELIQVEEIQTKQKDEPKIEESKMKKTVTKKPVQIYELQKRQDWKLPHADSDAQPLKFKKYFHKPYDHMTYTQNLHYPNPIHYFYVVQPIYIYRGLWIRHYYPYPNGFVFYQGYPYYVYNNHLHRYSAYDPGFFDLVDSRTDRVYATFYGRNLKQSYDRAAELRDILNNREGYYRYFCAERFEYDPDHDYNWDPADFSDWYWE
jgi:hypothetical protein